MPTICDDCWEHKPEPIHAPYDGQGICASCGKYLGGKHVSGRIGDVQQLEIPAQSYTFSAIRWALDDPKRTIVALAVATWFLRGMFRGSD